VPRQWSAFFYLLFAALRRIDSRQRLSLQNRCISAIRLAPAARRRDLFKLSMSLYSPSPREQTRGLLAPRNSVALLWHANANVRHLCYRALTTTSRFAAGVLRRTPTPLPSHSHVLCCFLPTTATPTAAHCAHRTPVTRRWRTGRNVFLWRHSLCRVTTFTILPPLAVPLLFPTVSATACAACSYSHWSVFMGDGS